MGSGVTRDDIVAASRDEERDNVEDDTRVAQTVSHSLSGHFLLRRAMLASGPNQVSRVDHDREERRLLCSILRFSAPTLISSFLFSVFRPRFLPDASHHGVTIRAARIRNTRHGQGSQFQTNLSDNLFFKLQEKFESAQLFWPKDTDLIYFKCHLDSVT